MVDGAVVQLRRRQQSERETLLPSDGTVHIVREVPEAQNDAHEGRMVHRMRRLSILTTVAVISSASKALANPVLADLYGGLGPIPLILATAFALTVEYVVVNSWLGPWLDRDQIGRAFIRINLLTFFPTQFLGLFFAWFAELVPLIVEPLLYERVATRVDVKIPSLRSKVVGANLLSFLAGLVAYWIVGLPALR